MTTEDAERSEVEKFISLMDVEYCRFCGRSGIYLGKLQRMTLGGNGSEATSMAARMMQSGPASSILTEPCHCLRRHYRFAHMPCLIQWIHTNLTNRCPDCSATYNCIHKVTPVGEWKTSPSTDRMMGQYCSAILVAIIIGILDGIVIWLVWLTTLPIPLRVTVILVLFAMYTAGMIAIYSRCAIVYHKMYIYNCPVVDVVPQVGPTDSQESLV